MTTPILTKVVGLDTSAHIWKCLQEQFASHTCAQIQKMKLLRKTPKNDKTIYAYLHDIKKVVNMLVAISSPITTEDHIESILDWLPEEYNVFIVVVTSCIDPYSINEIDLSYLLKKNVFRGINLLTPIFKLMLLLFILSIIKPHLFVRRSINTPVVVIFRINPQADILHLMDLVNFIVILGPPLLVDLGNPTDFWILET